MTPIKPGPGEVSTRTLAHERPEVRIKLRKNKDDTYSWEITGEDPDAVLDADKELRAGTAGSAPRDTR